jgi:hypothetical protein
MNCSGLELAQIVGMDPKLLDELESHGLPVVVDASSGERVYNSEAVTAWLILALRAANEHVTLRRALTPATFLRLVALRWVMDPRLVALLIRYCLPRDAAQ